jgi:hypothetical protein
VFIFRGVFREYRDSAREIKKDRIKVKSMNGGDSPEEEIGKFFKVTGGGVVVSEGGSDNFTAGIMKFRVMNERSAAFF